VNNRTNTIYFDSHKDEYINLYFKTEEADLAKDRVFVELDGYGVPLITLTSLGRGGWQAGIRMPLASPGPHGITIRTQNSGPSNAFTIIVGAPTMGEAGASVTPPEGVPEIYAVENSSDGTAVFRGYRNEHVCCYFTLANAALKRADLTVEAGLIPLPIDFLTDLGGGKWQTNSRLSVDLTYGIHAVRIRVAGGAWSNAAEIEVRRQS
jgi:hypothetical protein